VKTAFRFLSNKVYDHTFSEEEKNLAFGRLLVNKISMPTSSMIFCVVRRKRGKSSKLALTQQVAELECLLMEVAHGH